MAFQPISIAPKDGTPIEAPLMATMRYMPYRAMFATKYGFGRWQMKVGNTWHNVPFEPKEWQPAKVK